MTYSDDGLTNPEMEWFSLISVLMMVILTNSDSDFVKGRVDGVEGRVDGVKGRVDVNPLATNSCLLWRWLNEPT